MSGSARRTSSTAAIGGFAGCDGCARVIAAVAAAWSIAPLELARGRSRAMIAPRAMAIILCQASGYGTPAITQAFGFAHGAVAKLANRAIDIAATTPDWDARLDAAKAQLIAGRFSAPAPMAAARAQLTARRDHEGFEIRFGRAPVFVGLSHFWDGTPAELFLRAAKDGTELDAVIRECGLLASLLLQFGVSAETIYRALPKGEADAPIGPVGLALAAIAHMTDQGGSDASKA